MTTLSTASVRSTAPAAVRFTVERLVPGRVFVDVSHLLGARLVFDHRVTPHDDGGCTVEVTATVSGPLRLLWTAILGAGIRASAQADLDRLAAVAEGRQVLA